LGIVVPLFHLILTFLISATISMKEIYNIQFAMPRCGKYQNLGIPNFLEYAVLNIGWLE